MWILVKGATGMGKWTGIVLAALDLESLIRSVC